MKIPGYFIIIIIILTLSSTCWASDTSEKGDECSNFDHCKIGEELFRTCSCDNDCHKYHTCCLDADNMSLMSSEKQQYYCHTDRTVTPVYAKRSCLDTSRGHASLPHLCVEAESDRADVLGNILVTSMKTRITYWNRDCGLCNNEDISDLRLWTIQVTCPSRHEDRRFNNSYIEKHLSFDKDIEEWGLKVPDGFKICSLGFFQPRNMVGQLSYCAPNLVSGCPSNFPDNEIVEKCSMYHAERKQKNTDVYFKNVDCALCNGVNEGELDCVGRNYGPIRPASGKDLVKVSFDGEWLEREGAEQYKCSINNTWDPFSRRCRKLPEDIWRAITAPKLNNSQRTTADVCIFVLVGIFFLNKYAFK